MATFTLPIGSIFVLFISIFDLLSFFYLLMMLFNEIFISYIFQILNYHVNEVRIMGIQDIATTGFAKEDSILNDVGHIGDAFSVLFRTGDIGGFLKELFQAADGIGVFLIVYGLMVYISKITIFKSPDHGKYAHFFGIGVALIAVTNNQVYSILTNLLAGSFLVFIIIIFVVFGLIIFINKMRSSNYETKTEMRHNQAASAEATRDSTKILNEVGATERLANREHSTRVKTRTGLMDLKNVSNNSKRLIAEMRMQLGRAGTLQSQGESTRQLRQGILDRISTFSGSLKEEHTYLTKLKSAISELRKLSIKELELDNQGIMLDHRLDAILADLSKNDTHFDKDELVNSQHLKAYIGKIHQLESNKKQIEDQMVPLINNAEDNVSQIELLQKDFVKSLSRGDIAASLNALNAIDLHLNKINEDDDRLAQEVSSVESQMNELADLHNAEHKNLIKLLMEEKKEVKEDIHEEKEEVKLEQSAQKARSNGGYGG